MRKGSGEAGGKLLGGGKEAVGMPLHGFFGGLYSTSQRPPFQIGKAFPPTAEYEQTALH